MSHAIRIVLFLLAFLPSAALAQQGCPYVEGQHVEAQWDTTPRDWFPALVVSINGPDSPYCGITVRFLEGPADDYFAPDRTWGMTVENVRPATGPVPVDDPVGDGSYHLCPEGGVTRTDYLAVDPGKPNKKTGEAPFIRAIAELHDSAWDSEMHAYISELRFGAPYIATEFLAITREIPANEEVYTVQAMVGICRQHENWMSYERNRIEYTCHADLFGDFLCRQDRVLEHLESHMRERIR